MTLFFLYDKIMLVMFMKNRSELREIAMQTLYQKYIYDNSNIEYDIKNIIKELLEVENDFVDTLVNGVIEHEKDIIKLANKYLLDWKIDRLSKVDKAIISIGIYELMYTDTPPLVVINEAIELSKKYSDETVTSMINATLDKIYHEEVENGR